MTHSLKRFFASVLLGVLIALPVFIASQLIMGTPIVLAEAAGDPDDLVGGGGSELSADALLGGVGGETGLGDEDFDKTVGSLINVALGLLGVIAIVIVLAGGFLWMVAGGNEEKVSKAKRLLIAGVIGLAIILSAYAISSFVLSSLISATA
jgi:hypothetical protein